MKPCTLLLMVAVAAGVFCHRHGQIRHARHIVRTVSEVRDEGDSGTNPFDCRREAAEGLPVPVVRGTRVAVAEFAPPAKSARGETAPDTTSKARDRDADRNGVREVAGRLSATEERSKKDARLILEREVSDWVFPDVPRSWKVPGDLVDPMIGNIRIRSIEKDYGTLYEATQHVDFSPAARERIVEAYQREVVLRRLAVLGGVLAFVLSCLSALSAYIRADEATKGYYTNHLRAVAAAGVGAAGVLIYQLLS